MCLLAQAVQYALGFRGCQARKLPYIVPYYLGRTQYSGCVTIRQREENRHQGENDVFPG
jgi:hypothetical protein